MKFSDIPGHDDVKRRLRAMVNADRIPHALLLEGVEGIGKLALARAFAQYVHCQNRGIDGEPCGHCSACVQHQTFNHPDLFFSFPVYKKASESMSSDDYIDEWREFLKHSSFASFEDWVNILQPGTKQPVIYNSEGNEILHKLSMKSYSAPYKVMIMWLPEKMNQECANRLLKMIEEPFDHTILLFVSNNPGEILPTIYSRIQRIKLRRFSDDIVTQWLESNCSVEQQTARSIAALADGSITKAMSLIEVKDDSEVFLNYFKDLMRKAYNKDVRNLKIWSEEVADFKRERTGLFLVYLSRMIRENFIYNMKNHSLSYMTRPEEEFSAKFCPFVNERNVTAMLAETDRAAMEVARNANAKIVLFDYALKMIVALRM